MSCQVEVQQGHLLGKECSYNGKKYYSFEGIPYAKPPIGKLRFRDPQEPEKWSGILDATKPGNKCIQIDLYSKKMLGGSEDCLFLNVYTPSLPKEKISKLPVVFFVHGGRFVLGYGDYYRPEYFIENDTILVTINYRLHVLGFLCLNTPEVPGNAALKDTVMALKWVKNNISNFNGDNNNITVFGESAGGAIVTSFLTTKLTHGLFHKLISESGCSISDLCMIEEDPIFKAKYLASVLGQEFTDVKSLYNFLVNVPINDLLAAFRVLETSRPRSIINAYFLPVVEKKFDGVKQYFEEYPIVSLRENRFKKVPMLYGLNSHEGAFFVQRNKNGHVYYENDLRYFVPRYLFVKLNSPEALKIANKIRDYYFKGQIIDDTKKLEYIKFVTEAYFFRDMLIFMESIAKFHELYLLQMSYSGNINTRVMKSLGLKGSTHCDFLQYHFYRKNKADDATDQDKKMLSILNEIICNFAKNGIPSWSTQTVEWKPYTRDSRPYLNIDVEPQVSQNFGYDCYKFWTSLGDRSKL